MEYKPAPGEPYRPVLSAPSRLSSLLPEWSRSSCTVLAALFNGVDPPRALKPAEILTPRVTSVFPTASVAAAATVAAPASGIRANEPSRTPSPSTVGDKEATILSDPDTGDSGSEVSEPSSSDPKQVDPKNTDSNVVDSGKSNTNKQKSSNPDPPDIRPSIPGSEITPAEAFRPRPNTEDIDPEHANLSPSYSQDIEPQLLEGNDEPEETHSSNPEVSNPDDPSADISSPDRSQPNVPDTFSNVADSSSSNENSENPLPDGYTPPVTDSSGKHNPSPDSQGAEEADSSINNLDSSNGALKQTTSKGKEAALSDPKKSPAADPEVTSDDGSDVKSIDNELDPFDILPSKISNNDEALSPSAKSVDGQPSTPNDREGDQSSQPESLKHSPSENNANDDNALAYNAILPQYSSDTLPTAESDAVADLLSKPTPTDDSTLSPSYLTIGLPTADSDAMADLSDKTTPAYDSATPSQHSANAIPSTFTDAAGDTNSKIEPTDDSASATSSSGVSKNPGSASSPAMSAGSNLLLGSGKASSSKYQGKDVNAPASDRVKSSGSSLLAMRRHPKRNGLISARGLLYGFCIYVLPGVLNLL